MKHDIIEFSGFQEYKDWVSLIKKKIMSSQLKASIAVNQALISFYFDLGYMICQKQKKTNWGDKLILQLSKDLKKELPYMSGFSRSNLYSIKKFYLYFKDFKTENEIVQQAVGQIENEIVQQAVGQIENGIVQQTVGQIKNGIVQQAVGQIKNEIVQQAVGQIENGIVQQAVGQIENGIVQQAVGQIEKHNIPNIISKLPWGHICLIMNKIKDKKESLFYIVETVENNWSRDVLGHQIKSNLYQRQGQSINNFARTLPTPQSELATQILKDPYKMEFVGISNECKEKDIEDQLYENITKFLLELGKGFAFVGRQYSIECRNKSYRLDLLFYHVVLKCYVVIELKNKEFKPEHAGKLNFYLSLVDSYVKRDDDKPTIGILLCRDKDNFEVEFALRDLNKPIGVSEYELTDILSDDVKSSLPTIEEIETELTEGLKDENK